MEILFKKFRIQTCLKKTEFSAVYKAEHIFLKSQIILKTLDIKRAADKTLLQRFKREARILAELQHPNIIRVLDFGEENDIFYISFEYFPGTTLREVINKNTLTLDQKKHIIAQAACGLDYAHQKSIIHRDIKPENILLDRDLNLKIADFGLAFSGEASNLTGSLAVMGTPAYMSPEQLNGQPIDASTDLFALGIIACELLIGKNPFLGEDPRQTINTILKYNRETLNEIAGKTGKPENIINCLLQPEPENRKIPEELLQRNVESKPVQQTGNKKRILWIPIAALVLIILSVMILWDFSSENEDMQSPAVDKNKINDSLKTQKENLTDSVNSPDVATAGLNEDLNKTINPSKTSPEIHAEREIIPGPAVLQKGALMVECSPWAYVWVDSKKVDSTPLSKALALDPGMHLLTLQHPDYPEYSDSVRIESGELTTVNINLNDFCGYLLCQVFPWAEVFINGKKEGQTPFENPLQLPIGEHRLQLLNPEFESFYKMIKISPGDTLIFQYNFNDKKIGIIFEK